MRHSLTAIILTLTLLPALAQAQTYRWVDEHGAVHYSQGLQGIPERYRSQAQSLDLGSPRPTPGPAEKPLSPSPSLAPTVPLPAARPPSRWEPSGALPEITRVSFPRGSHILVDAMINGQGPVKLALDTGSHQTHVSAQAVRTLGISAPSYPCRRCEIEIIGGTKVVREVQILSLKVGDAEMTGPAFIDDTDFYERLGAVGTLGRDFLDNFRVTIHSRQQVVTLVPTSMSGPGKHEPSAAHGARIPFPPHPYILVSSTINGRGPITLILDTGAPRTRLSAKALRSLGISPTNAESREGRAGKVRIARVDVTSVEVGGAKVGPLRIGAYFEMETIAGADGLLGLDFLKKFTVTIDPRERVVTLEGAGALEGPSDPQAPAGIPARLPQLLWVVVLAVLGFWALRRLEDFLMPRPSRGRFFLFFRPKRMLTPLRELLDYPSSKTLGGSLEGNRLRGQFRGRAVACSLIGTGWGSSECRITLSCQSRWRFVVSRRTGFSLAEWVRGRLNGNVVFEVGDVELDRNFRFARRVDKTMGIDPREPCAAWLRRPEVRQGVEALLLSYGVTRLGTLDDPRDFIQDLEAWHRSGAPIPDGLQVTYSPCRKRHLEVGNVRAVLEELEKLAQSLPTSLGPWEPSLSPRVGLR